MLVWLLASKTCLVFLMFLPILFVSFLNKLSWFIFSCILGLDEKCGMDKGKIDLGYLSHSFELDWLRIFEKLTFQFSVMRGLAR